MATVRNVNRFGKELTLDQMMRQFKKKCEKENKVPSKEILDTINTLINFHKIL